MARLVQRTRERLAVRVASVEALQAAGEAAVVALELADDAAETEIRAALMRVSAAKAD